MSLVGETVLRITEHNSQSSMLSFYHVHTHDRPSIDTRGQRSRVYLSRGRHELYRRPSHQSAITHWWMGVLAPGVLARSTLSSGGLRRAGRISY